MFYCEAGHLSRPGEVRVPVVTEVRPVEYRTTKMVRNRKTKEEDEVLVRSSQGTEIVKEEAYCSSHAAAAPTLPQVSNGETKVIPTVL